VRSTCGRIAFLLAALACAVSLACAGSASIARSSMAADAHPTAPAALAALSAVNGCDPATALAVEGGEATIEFGGANGERYRPRCVAIKAGEAVHFKGDFARHPMTGGAVIEGEPVRDPFSPLPYTNAGSEATFRADRTGVYPFYCQVHWVLGMNGVVYVR
jgi:plastocyanin